MIRTISTIALLLSALALPASVLAQPLWVDIEPLPTPRAFPSVAVLYGQIFVIGGRDANGQALDVVERYDPGLGTWSAVDSLDKARYNASATVFNGQILLTGGREDDYVLTDDVEVYDPIDDRWESFDSLDKKREGHRVASIGANTFVLGGLGEAGQYLDDAEVYNEGEGSWEAYAFWTIDKPRASFAAVREGSGILVFGGFGAFGPIAQVEHFVPGQSGSTRAALPEPRGSLAAATAVGLVFAIGGRNAAGDVIARVDAYDATTNQWESWPALPEPREGAVAADYGGMLYVFGGKTDNGELATTCLELMPVVANEPPVPEAQLALDLLGPNPFYNSTVFVLEIDRPTELTLDVYDALGRRVALLHQGQVQAGRRDFAWDGSDQTGRPLSSGTYFVRATDGRQTAMRRITRLR